VLPAGIRRLFRLGRGTKDVAADVDAELRFHLEEKIAALIAGGLTPPNAREEALRQFGDVQETRAALEAIDRRDAVRAQRRAWGGDWLLDVRHALRSLRRTPGVTAAVVVMLALGIGANAAMFDILDRLFVRPPSGIDRPGEVVRLYMRVKDYFSGRLFAHGAFDMEQYEALTAGVDGFREIAGFSTEREHLGRGQQGGQARVAVVTGTYFGLLGVRPLLGRLLGPDDDVASAPPAAVLSHSYWRGQLRGRSDVLRTTLTLNEVTYTIVGVTAPGFDGIDPNAAQVWVAAHIAGPAERGVQWRMHSRGGLGLFLVARLRSGVTAPAVQDAATAVLRRLEASAQYGDTTLWALTGPIQLLRGPSTIGRPYVLALIVGAVAVVVLLIAAANVAGLLLVRAAGRRRELAVRGALGAGRWRIGRLLLAESLLLAALSGAAATLVAAAAARVLRVTLLPSYEWTSGPLDVRVLAFAGLVAFGMGLLTGVAPAVQAGRGAGAEDLRAGTRAARRWRSPVRRALLVGQVALSVILLVGAALFVRSLNAARHTDLGFDVDRLAVVNLDNADGNDTASLSDERITALERRVRAVPGVVAVEQTTAALMSSYTIMQLRIPGLDSLPRIQGGFSVSGVTPSFFAAVGVPVLRGRAFNEGDDALAPKVTVVNDRMAELIWPGRDPLGKCLYVGGPTPQCRTIVGVVGTIRVGVAAEPFPILPQYYLPLAQAPHKQHARSLVVRVSDRPERVRTPILQALADLFPDLIQDRVQVLPETLAARIRAWRIGSGLVGAAALLALLLAAIGLYSVIAFGVKQREHEFGIRRALGAQTADLVRLVLKPGLGMALAGVVVGSGLALWASRFIKPLLFQGREPNDPVAFGVAAVVLLLVALAASLIPALAAAKADPRQALQAE
jgi:predicted permease